MQILSRDRDRRCYTRGVEPLVTPVESRLADGGLLALGTGLLLRLLLGYALTRQSWILDTQLIGCALLIIALNLAGLLLPRAYAAVPMSLGLLGWLAALTLLPRYFIWHIGARAHWLVWGLVALALASFVWRWLLARNWNAQITGKGWAWIDNWAHERSLRARVLAKKALVALGYRRARAMGDEAE